MGHKSNACISELNANKLRRNSEWNNVKKIMIIITLAPTRDSTILIAVTGRQLIENLFFGWLYAATYPFSIKCT